MNSRGSTLDCLLSSLSPSQVTSPIRSRGVLGHTIFGSQATLPAESGHVLDIAKSGALPFQWGHVAQFLLYYPTTSTKLP